MFRGVTDLNVNFLRNWEFPRAVSHYAFRQIGVRTTHGVFTPSHIPPLFDSSLGHVPLIDHNPRKGEKIEFTPSEAQRYKERSQAVRTNARLKDDYGGRHIRVRGNAKVMSHLMFGILALTADQILR